MDENISLTVPLGGFATASPSGRADGGASLLRRLQALNWWHFVWMAVLLSELLTLAMNSVMSLIRWGHVDRNLLEIGTVDAFCVSLIVAFVVIGFLRRTARLEEMNALLQEEIAERERVQAALRDSETNYQSIYDASNDAILVHDMHSTAILDANAKMCELFGYSKDETARLTLQDLFADTPPYTADEALNYFRRAVREGSQAFEWCCRDKSGRRLWMEVSLKRALVGQEERMLAVLRDITEQKLAQDKVRCQLERMTSLHTIDVAISSSLDLNLTLNMLLGEVMAQLPVDAAMVALLKPHENVLEFRGSIGLRMKHRSLRAGDGLMGRVVREHQQVTVVRNVSDLDGGDPLMALMQDEGFRSLACFPLLAKGEVKGVLGIFQRHSPPPSPDHLHFLEIVAGQAAIAVDNIGMFGQLQRSHTELMMAYESTIEGWSRALDFRDKETEGHSQRVTELTVNIAGALGMNDDELVHIRRGALLHDIGKLGVPDGILLKEGPLTDEEWVIMKRHPEIAFELLTPISFLRQAIDIPYCHHEKWDGTGYPRGLREKQIPLAARIFAIVDVWDALRSDRPYRKAWPVEKTIEHIRSQSGMHFDPDVVRAFLTVVDRPTLAEAAVPHWS